MNLDEELISLALKGNLHGIKSVIAHGAMVNYVKDTITEPFSALAAAASKDDHKIVQFLLEKGAEVNLLNAGGKSALFFAAQYGHHQTIKLLLEYGAKVNSQDAQGRSALMYACLRLSFDLQVLKLLLRRGAQVNLQDRNGKSALMFAINNNNLVVDFLLKNGAQVDLKDNRGRSALMLACDSFYSNLDTLKLLLKCGAQVGLQDNDGRCALSFACEKGIMEYAQLLIDYGAEIDLQDNDKKSALMYATGSQNPEVMKMLLDHGAEVDLQESNGNSSLMCLAEVNNTKIMKHMLDKGAHVDLQDNIGRSALMFASEKGQYDSVKVLLQRGAQVVLQDNQGRSALTYAFEKQEVDVAKQLLQSWAKRDLEHIKGRSALILACQNQHLHDVSLLLEDNSKLNLQDGKGWSALMRAVESRSIHKITQLLNKGADVNLQNHENVSALMIASRNGDLQIVRLLLGNKAEVDSIDRNGRPALMYANEDGHSDVVGLLIEHGAHFSDTYLKNQKGISSFESTTDTKNIDLLPSFGKFKTAPSYPGIIFSAATKKVSVDTAEINISMEEAGISLSIPEDAVSPTDPPLEVQIQPCFSGSWEVPENLELVSPAYIVKPSRDSEVVFKKKVMVKIWHHANLETEEDCEHMVFLSASTTPEYREGSPVYVFREITGVKGSFRPREEQPVGEIALKHFCILTLGKHKHRNKGHLYSARLYKSKEKKSVVFCICLFQPHYIETCDDTIVADYKISKNGSNPVVFDAVTITGNEVCVKEKCSKIWTTFCNKSPALILKKAIGIQRRYKPYDLKSMGYPPRIEITIVSVPDCQNSEPLEIYIEGLDVATEFKLLPGEFIDFEVDTAIIKLHQFCVHGLWPKNDTWSGKLNMLAGSTSEWHAATSLFIANAENLMKSVCNVLKSTKSALELPNNYLTSVAASQPPPFHNYHNSATVPSKSACQLQSTTALECCGFAPTMLNCSSTPLTAVHSQTHPSPDQCSLFEEHVPTQALLSTSSSHKARSKPLSINDAAVVYKNLYTLRAKWKTMGMFLCVPHHSLEAIGADNESCDDRLTALIALWLRRITPTPTWHALSDAVQYIDQDKAREIMTNNCGR